MTKRELRKIHGKVMNAHGEAQGVYSKAKVLERLLRQALGADDKLLTVEEIQAIHFVTCELAGESGKLTERLRKLDAKLEAMEEVGPQRRET